MTNQIRVYHRTYASETILKEGFKDGEGNYMTSETWKGVWVSNRPLDANEGAFGDFIIVLEIPEEIFIQYEWEEDEKPYKESLIPAEILNEYRPFQILSDEELEADNTNQIQEVKNDSNTRTKNMETVL